MLVSIGLPFLNSLATLPSAIRSVFAQTYAKWELLLVDDGSIDGALQFARSLDDSRVRVFSDGSNLGLSARLNQIAELARGEWLFRMDADDVMVPTRLERQLRVLCASDSPDVVCSSVFLFDGANRIYGLRGAVSPACTGNLPFDKEFIVHPTVAAPRSWFRTHPYNETYLRGQDKELWLRVAHDTKFAHLSDPTLYYREQGNFALRDYRAQKATDRRLLREYGRKSLSTTERCRRMGEAHLKENIYAMLYSLHLHPRLLRARGRPLPPSAQNSAQAVLDRVLTTPLPLTIASAGDVSLTHSHSRTSI